MVTALLCDTISCSHPAAVPSLHVAGVFFRRCSFMSSAGLLADAVCWFPARVSLPEPGAESSSGPTSADGLLGFLTALPLGLAFRLF